jgi:hypothetical protein
MIIIRALMRSFETIAPAIAANITVMSPSPAMKKRNPRLVLIRTRILENLGLMWKVHDNLMTAFSPLLAASDVLRHQTASECKICTTGRFPEPLSKLPV